ncbi:Helix-turn-helix [Cohaesibacter sp. ES.047]|nr:Helix-turn-helix [Cohaesibacter sp. ES.047]
MCDSGHPLQVFMDLKKWKQIEAADALGCAASTISRILKDDRWPPAEMINAVEHLSCGAITFQSFQAYFRNQEAGDAA